MLERPCVVLLWDRPGENSAMKMFINMHYYKNFTSYWLMVLVIKSSGHTSISIYPHILKRIAEIFQRIESSSVSSSQGTEMLFDLGCLCTLQ